MPAAIAAISVHVNSDSQRPRHKMHYFAGSGTLVAQDLSKDLAPALPGRIKAQRIKQVPSIPARRGNRSRRTSVQWR
jgi:hypothetical protein